MIHGVARNAFIAREKDTSNAQCVLGQGMKCVSIVEEQVGLFAAIVMAKALLSVTSVMGLARLKEPVVDAMEQEK